MGNVDIDVDAGYFGIGNENTSTPSEVKPTRVRPNPKCNGCMHFKSDSSWCQLGLAPKTCGDGTEPETGYAPIIMDAVTHAMWRQKRGLQHIVPKSPALAQGNTEGPSYVVHVIGDSAITLSQAEASFRKNQYPEFQKALTASDVVVVEEVGFSIDKGQLGYSLTVEIDKSQYDVGSWPSRQHAVGAALAVMGKAYVHPFTEEQKWRMNVITDAKARKNAPKATPAPGNPTQGARPGNTSKPKMSFKQKVKEHICGKSDQASKMHPMLRKVRERVMMDPAGGQDAAHKHGSGAVFKHDKLAQAAGVHENKISALALESHHAGEFIAKMRKEHGKKIKHLSNSQIRSAYHSLGFQNSIGDTDMRKGLKEISRTRHGSYHISKLSNGKIRLHFASHAGGYHNSPRKIGEHSSLSSVNRAVARHSKQMVQATQKNRWSGKGMPVSDLEIVKSDAKRKVQTFVNKKFSRGASMSKGVWGVYHNTKGLVSSHSNYKDAKKNWKKISKPTPGGHTHYVMKVKKSFELTEIDLDLVKSDAKGERRVIGHTSTSKVIYSDAHGADKFTSEEHTEAAKVHRDISDRLNRAIAGFPTDYNSSMKAPAHHTAAKYLRECAEKHILLARRHEKTVMDIDDVKRRATYSDDYQAHIQPVEGFGSFSLSMSPSDDEIAKAVQLHGIDGLSKANAINAPLNVKTPLAGKQTTSLPDAE